MRFFIGLSEQCNIVTNYAKALRSLGHETFTVVRTRESYNLESQYDEVLADRVVFGKGARSWRKTFSLLSAWVIVLSLFLRALITCDVFVFVFGTSFLPGFWDYPVLKMCGKRIVSVFLGSDIRYWYAYEQETRLLGWDPNPNECPRSDPSHSFARKMDVVRAAERYADLILSQPSMSQLLTRPYMRMSIPIDLSQYRFHVPDRQVPLVVHAPSDRGIKGTTYVLSAVDRLRREGICFEFRLVEGVPNKQVRAILAEADIVVDQPVYGTTLATLSLESLATGSVVLTRYAPRYARIPADCPAVNVNRDTLSGELRRVIQDRGLRRRLASVGREYVEKHHDHVRVMHQMLDWLRPGGIEAYDFVPTFFRDSFTMPQELIKAEESRVKSQRRGRLPVQIRRLLLWPLHLYH